MVIPRFPVFVFPVFPVLVSDGGKVFGARETQRIDVERSGKIFERGKFGLRDYFSAFYISCVVGFELLERCYSL